ncbi:MAG: ribosome-associated translation inhibitor RaiA [Thermomicrobiales bacterium]
MDLQIRTIGTTVTDELQELIDRKVSRLDRLAQKVVDAQLELRTVPLGPNSESTKAQLTLQTGRNVLRAEVRDPEPGKAIDGAFEKLISQVRKVNDKRTTRRRQTGVELGAIRDHEPALADAAENLIMSQEDDGEETEAEGKVVRRKRFPMKPMPVDEAIDQMELVGHDFFLFLNVEENQYNVLYRRKDGDYGLLMTS